MHFSEGSSARCKHLAPGPVCSLLSLRVKQKGVLVTLGVSRAVSLSALYQTGSASSLVFSAGQGQLGSKTACFAGAPAPP